MSIIYRYVDNKLNCTRAFLIHLLVYGKFLKLNIVRLDVDNYRRRKRKNSLFIPSKTAYNQWD